MATKPAVGPTRNSFDRLNSMPSENISRMTPSSARLLDDVAPGPRSESARAARRPCRPADSPARPAASAAERGPSSPPRRRARWPAFAGIRGRRACGGLRALDHSRGCARIRRIEFMDDASISREPQVAESRVIHSAASGLHPRAVLPASLRLLQLHARRGPRRSHRRLLAGDRRWSWPRCETPREVDTLYFGGGTPTHLSPEQFRQLARRSRASLAPPLALGRLRMDRRSQSGRHRCRDDRHAWRRSASRG